MNRYLPGGNGEDECLKAGRQVLYVVLVDIPSCLCVSGAVVLQRKIFFKRRPFRIPHGKREKQSCLSEAGRTAWSHSSSSVGHPR